MVDTYDSLRKVKFNEKTTLEWEKRKPARLDAVDRA
jgi:hypothetical protein